MGAICKVCRKGEDIEIDHTFNRKEVYGAMTDTFMKAIGHTKKLLEVNNLANLVPKSGVGLLIKAAAKTKAEDNWIVRLPPAAQFVILNAISN